MDDDQKVEEVIEGEITEETTSDVAGNGADQATAMVSLEELIKNHIDSTSKLRDEIKQAREMYEDSFNNNPTYRESSEKVKEVSKSRSSLKQQIAKQPSVATVAQKLKDLRFDLNEQMKTLSDLLQDYHEQTGLREIEDRRGQVLEIVSTAKLVKKSKYNP